MAPERSGDVIFDVARFSHGQDITEEEREQYIEHVVAGHIAQLDSQASPTEEDFKKMVLRVMNSSGPQTETHVSESAVRWVFDGHDRVRKDDVYEGTREDTTTMVINGDVRYLPRQRKAERSSEGFPGSFLGDYWTRSFPAYFGRCYAPLSDLANPRLLRTEEIDGIKTYVLEADLPSAPRVDGTISRRVVQLWVEPDRGYVVHKLLTYIDVFEEYLAPLGLETSAESFVEVSPGVYYPQTITRSTYVGQVYSGKIYLQKKWEAAYTQREGEFNRSIPVETFDLNIPLEVEITEYEAPTRWTQHPASEATEEYLEQIYDELEQIRLYDDSSAPGSRKLVFNMSRKRLGTILRAFGVIYTPAIRNGDFVGVHIVRIDPAIAAEVPFLPEDIIYTLNDEPWKVRGTTDFLRGMESSTTRVNSGLPLTLGFRRNGCNGELMYMVLWLD